jgi:hypothetical protein
VPGTEYAPVQCEFWSDCAPGTFVSAAPNNTHNRKCEPCPAEHYSDTTNAESCSAWRTCGKQSDETPRLIGASSTASGRCDDCASGSWAAAVTDNCLSHTTCDLGTSYQTQSPTNTRDRICTNVTTCVLGQTYEIVAPNLVRNRLCDPVRNCSEGLYVSQEPSLTQNRVCEACVDSYSDSINSPSCSSWIDCGKQVNGDARRVGHTMTSPGTCNDCSDGTWAAAGAGDCQTHKTCTSEEYQVGDPSATEDRNCTEALKCIAGEYESQAPSGKNNRQCSDCQDNTNSLAEAKTCSLCNPGYGSTGSVNAGGHIICEVCANANHKYNNKTDESACGDVPACGPGFGYVVSPTATPDTTYGDDCVACEDGTFSNETDYSLCKSYRAACVVGQTYQSVSPTAQNDRVCTQVQECSKGENIFGTIVGEEYESAAPTINEDRKCQTMTTCEQDVSYQTQAPTDAGDRYTTDRICTNVTKCVLGSTYETSAPTLTENRQCADVTDCGATQYQTSAPTLTENRQCANVTECSLGTYEIYAATATSNRQCYRCSGMETLYTQKCATKCNGECPTIKQQYNTHCQTCSA